jgi:integrase/recombinase XerD
MDTAVAINLFKKHEITTHKLSTQVGYAQFLTLFQTTYADRAVESISVDEISLFLESFTTNVAETTRRLRFSQVKAFFNFLISECSLQVQNPCDYPILAKQYKNSKQAARKILDKEVVDEIIYSTASARDRLILELQARCGLRVGEVLKLKVSDVTDRKLIIQEPKSGKESEIAFMPEQIAKRVAEYITASNLGPDDRLFPVCYSTVRALINRLAGKFHLKISPHDFRRHSATYASRNGVPLEIVSKVLLRHHDLKTTQVYLGKITDSEAIRWMDVLHGK